MATTLDVVIPVLDEQVSLCTNITRLHRFLQHSLSGYEWRIIIADNGSADSTPEIAKALSQQLPSVEYLRLNQRGRGRALHRAWLDSGSDIVGYMDVDLSTNLNSLPKLVSAVDDEGYDIAIGSRLAMGAQVSGRPLRRELLSRAYSLIFKAMFLTAFHDAQCGFKVLRGEVANRLVPLVRDTGWFFDTELLIVAEKAGYEIKEVPVQWVHDPDSRVRMISTVYEDVKGLLRLRFGGLRKATRHLASTKAQG